MNQENIVRGLRRRLLVERVVFGVLAFTMICWWACAHFKESKSFILVDGKPLVCVPSENDAKKVLYQVRADTGLKPSDIQFKEEVRVARAPRDARPVSRGRAVRVVRSAVSPLIARWAIIVDGIPVAAVPSREIAGETLDLAKLRFGKLVDHLAEEPQFRENVTVDVAAVPPSIYCKSPQDAVDALFNVSAPVSKDAIYVVRDGDVASSIAYRHGMKLDRLWAMNPGVNLHRLQIGDKIRIKAVESSRPRLTVVVRNLEERTERVPPPLQRVSSAQLYAGRSTEISPGSSGLRRVKVAMIYENGRKAGSEIVEEQVLREPTPRRIAVGIKPPGYVAK